jgi:preprotein translocase subunit SecB
MSDEQPTQQIEIQKIYLKDVSLETPNSPQIFTQQGTADTNLQIGNGSKQIAEDIYEVVLTLTVTVKVDDKTAYLVEVQQAGIFNIGGFPAEQMGALLGAFCPNVLFPYAREALDSLVTKGGFPPILLRPVDFNSIYLQHQQARQAEAETQH